MKRHISLTKSTGNSQVDRALDEIRRKVNPVLKNLNDTIVNNVTDISKAYGGLHASSPALDSGWDTVDTEEIYSATGSIFLCGGFSVQGTTTMGIRWVIDSDVAPTTSFNGTISPVAGRSAGEVQCYWSTTVGSHTVKLQYNLTGSYSGVNDAIATITAR